MNIETNTNVRSCVTFYKISPRPSLPKRGIKSPTLKKGDEGGFPNFIYYVCTNRVSFFKLFSHEKGFTLIEVLISLAIIGGLLVTLIYSLNHHLGIAGRQEFITVATILAKEKIYEMEKKPFDGKGDFQAPYSTFSYETRIKESTFPGMMEIGVIVKSGNDAVNLSMLIQKR